MMVTISFNSRTVVNLVLFRSMAWAVPSCAGKGAGGGARGMGAKVQRARSEVWWVEEM